MLGCARVIARPVSARGAAAFLQAIRSTKLANVARGGRTPPTEMLGCPLLIARPVSSAAPAAFSTPIPLPSRALVSCLNALETLGPTPSAALSRNGRVSDPCPPYSLSPWSLHHFGVAHQPSLRSLWTM